MPAYPHRHGTRQERSTAQAAVRSPSCRDPVVGLDRHPPARVRGRRRPLRRARPGLRIRRPEGRGRGPSCSGWPAREASCATPTTSAVTGGATSRSRRSSHPKPASGTRPAPPAAAPARAKMSAAPGDTRSSSKPSPTPITPNTNTGPSGSAAASTRTPSAHPRPTPCSPDSLGRADSAGVQHGSTAPERRPMVFSAIQLWKFLCSAPQHRACAKFGTKRLWVRIPPARPMNPGLTAFSGSGLFAAGCLAVASCVTFARIPFSYEEAIVGLGRREQQFWDLQAALLSQLSNLRAELRDWRSKQRGSRRPKHGEHTRAGREHRRRIRAQG